MPNGVICGGAVDGSNQLGAIVTCHAMAARPDGAGAPAPTRSAPSKTRAPSKSQAKPRPRRAIVLRMVSSQERSFADTQVSYRPPRRHGARVQFHVYEMTLHRSRCGWKTGINRRVG